MKISVVEDRNEALLRALCRVWEKSVRATHLFLSDEEVEKIAGYIPSALREVQILMTAADHRDHPVAFMGINQNKLEMLFVAPKERGKGIGKRLVQYGIANYSIHAVCVNEQNPQAQRFYEHMGFRVDKRTDTDEQGNPYPLLYMSLPK